MQKRKAEKVGCRFYEERLGKRSGRQRGEGEKGGKRGKRGGRNRDNIALIYN